MTEESIDIAEAKKHFSELIGKVAYGKKRLLITKRGKPMARLVPVEESVRHLSDACGRLEDSDPFFQTIERIMGIVKNICHGFWPIRSGADVFARYKHLERAYEKTAQSPSDQMPLHPII